MQGRRKLLIGVAIVLGLALGMVGTALAVTFNPQADGNRHPYVGLVLFYDGSNNYLWRCSGTMLSSTVFLTAGHCTSDPVTPPVKAKVLLDPDLTDLAYPYPNCGSHTCVEGTPQTYPGYCSECAHGLPGFDAGDVGVVLLDEAWPLDEYGALPAEGLVDTLAMKSDVDLVGYGVQWQSKGGGIPPYNRWTGYRTRFFAKTQLVTANFVHSDEFIKLAANPAQDKGGTCFGDSGGPDLLGGTNTILAVNSYVTNSNCKGVTYSNRVDLKGVLDWVKGFLDIS